MRINKVLGLGVLTLGVIALGSSLPAPTSAASKADKSAVPLSTPFGIKIQPRGAAKDRYGVAAATAQLIYADAKGLPLYTYDADKEGGAPSCTAECAQAFPPAIAGATAKSFGDWSLVARADGAKQWAFKGKPLYTQKKDAERPVDQEAPPAAAAAGSPMAKPDAGPPPVPQGWQITSFEPAKSAITPYGIGIKEVANAVGQALVDEQDMTLYAFDGKAAVQLSDAWKPVAAPAIANAVGDFTLVERKDSSVQWAYKGKPLFTYTGDLKPGDANGIGQDKRITVALVMRYFAPENVAIQETPGHGIVWANNAGMTLYTQDRYRYNPGGNSARDGNHRSYFRGQLIGAKGCDAKCSATWKPFAAPADAEPNGHWDVLTRDDGSKQWAYEGYALYTYTGDKKPGDLTGNDVYSYVINEGDTVKVADGGAVEPATFWRIAIP